MSDRRGKWTQWRIRFIGGFFAVFFVITSARAFYLQVIQKEQLVKLAERQHQKTVTLTPGRGSIYDVNGAPLAVSIEMDSCYAEPRNLENPANIAAALAPALGMSKEQLEKKFAGSKGFVWLVRRMPPEQARQVKALVKSREIEGIGFVKETKRFYPNAEMAGHVIGFTGLDPEGLEGIELRYDATILGTTGLLVTERDALGRDVDHKGSFVKEASKGQNVTLTLDKNIQYIAEKELAAAVESSRAKGGIALVMDPHTGQVLAMANYPFFNPNSYSQYSHDILRNRAVTDSFEPGSTFKVFLIAAALEEKAISPQEAFNCENGSYAISGRIIHDTHSYGRLSVGDILKYSSNIGSAKIGARLGQEKLHNGLRRFGFGARSGIDLPGEVSGDMRDRSQWYGIDMATISFGQGVSATTMQLGAAMSAIANGGNLMKPYMVEKISDEAGTISRKFSPEVRSRVISSDTAKAVTLMMEGVTTNGGTGMSAAVDGYRVAGKTGTAQKVDPVTRGYSVDKRTASFAGFIPADNPRLTIVVIIDEPKTSPYGGVVAAPAFKAIAQQALCYLNVQPNQISKVRKEPVQEKKELVVAADPATAAAEGSIADGAEGAVMIDFRGQSMRQVLRKMEKRNLNVKLIGSGRAVEQNPAPGHRIGPADHVWVRFAPAG